MNELLFSFKASHSLDSYRGVLSMNKVSQTKGFPKQNNQLCKGEIYLEGATAQNVCLRAKSNIENL